MSVFLFENSGAPNTSLKYSKTSSRARKVFKFCNFSTSSVSDLEEASDDGAVISLETIYSSTGVIFFVADGIAKVRGLDNAGFGEMVLFPQVKGLYGVVSNLNRDSVDILILGFDIEVSEG